MDPLGYPKDSSGFPKDTIRFLGIPEGFLRICQGHLKDLVSIFVERYTYQKVKTALRAIRSGVSDEMVASQVLAEEKAST